jgi:serine/threonine protein kinase
MSQAFCPECGRVHEPDPGPCTRPPLVGQTLPGGLIVRARVGETSSGVIFRAESADTHCELQLVFTGTADAKPDPLHAQLARAAAITHPNVAAIRMVGETPDGVRYVAFEVCHGELLSEVLQAREVLPLAEAVDLILQAAAGIQAAHEAGVLHGHLSPETILVSSGEDDRPLLKLIRFGLTEPGPKPPETVAPYTAPERLAGQPPSVAGDVFSLGAVLHHMLSGHPPDDMLSGHPPDDARRVEGPLPAGVRAALMGALKPTPEQRFKSVAAFRGFLQGCESEGSPPERQAPRPTAGRRSRVALAGAIAMTAVGVTWWVVRGEHRSEPAMPPTGGTEVRVSPTSPPSVAPPAAATLPDTHTTNAERLAPRATARPARSPSPSPRSARPPQKANPETPAVEGYEAMATGPVVDDTSSTRLAPEERLPTTAPEEAGRTPTLPPPSPASKPIASKPAMTAPTDAMAEARAAAGRTLATYARALEANDLHAVEWIYPRITDRERTAWKKFFEVARDLVVTLNIERLAVDGAEARLDVEGNYKYWNRTLHRPEVAPVRFLATVRRDGDTWHLSGIR